MTNELISFWREYHPDQAPFVHPADAPVVRERHVALYNSYQDFTNSEALAGLSDKRLHLGLLPEPYVGDLNRASVFMLMANPGLDPSHYYLEHVVQSHREIQIRNLHQQLSDVDYPFYRLDPRLSWWKGFDYWRSRFRDVLLEYRRRAGTYQDGLKAVSRVFCVVQLIPYRSARFRPRFASRLRSAKKAIDYVQSVLIPRARNGEITLIVGRAAKHWSIGQSDLDHPHIIYSPAHARGGYLTTEGKEAILAALESA